MTKEYVEYRVKVEKESDSIKLEALISELGLETQIEIVSEKISDHKIQSIHYD